MKRFFTFLVFLFALPNALAGGYDLPLDSLSEWTGEKTINVVSNVQDLDRDTEFLALLGRLNVRGFDVNFNRSGLSDEGLVLEILEVNDKLAISMKSADSRKYLFSTLVDKAGEVERVADTKPAFDTATSPRRILPLPSGFNPERVSSLPTSAQDNPGRLVFLSDTKLVLGSVTSESIKLIDELQSDIKGSKAIYLTVGQSDSDPNPEVAVVWGQDRDISGKGQYTKIFSQLFEVDGGNLVRESDKTEDVAIRFIDSTLYAQRYELLDGETGKLRAASLTAGRIKAGEAIPSLSGQGIFSVYPVGESGWINVAESYLELQAKGSEPGTRLELGKVSSPMVVKRLKNRQIISSPDYAYSVNEQYLSIPRQVVVEDNKVITFMRKRTPAFAGLSSASGSDVIFSASWDSLSPGGGFSITPLHEIDSFVIDFSRLKVGDGAVYIALTNDQSGDEGASHIRLY